MIYTLIGIVDFILRILSYVILAQVIVSLLVAFNVINAFSPFVRSLMTGLDRLTAPIYRPIRKLLPDFGGIDFSPMVVLLVIHAIRVLVLPGILLEVGPTIT